MWALQKLRKLMTAHFGPNINVNALLASPTAEEADSEGQKAYNMVGNFNSLFVELLYGNINPLLH